MQQRRDNFPVRYLEGTWPLSRDQEWTDVTIDSFTMSVVAGELSTPGFLVDDLHGDVVPVGQQNLVFWSDNMVGVPKWIVMWLFRTWHPLRRRGRPTPFEHGRHATIYRREAEIRSKWWNQAAVDVGIASRTVVMPVRRGFVCDRCDMGPDVLRVDGPEYVWKARGGLRRVHLICDECHRKNPEGLVPASLDDVSRWEREMVLR